MERDGAGWSGMERDGAGWSGMERDSADHVRRAWWRALRGERVRVDSYARQRGRLHRPRNVAGLPIAAIGLAPPARERSLVWTDAPDLLVRAPLIFDELLAKVEVVGNGAPTWTKRNPIFQLTPFGRGYSTAHDERIFVNRVNNSGKPQNSQVTNPRETLI
jgi:hypothetical protein